jgi:hypothetical protein
MAAQFFPKLGCEVPGQENYVIITFTQRRNLYRKNRQSKKEISSKLALFNCFLQILVGCSDYANVDRYGSAAANPVDYFLLDGSQQFSLDSKW